MEIESDHEEEQTNGKDATTKTTPKSQQKQRSDENTEPPAKRLRTRAATAALSHQSK